MANGMFPSPPVAPTPERDQGDDAEEDAIALARERNRLDLPARTPQLDRETCEALGVTVESSPALIEAVCEALADLIAAGQPVEVMSFGKFRLRPYRPASPARLGDNSFVEAPYLGPVEFIASALLQRQLDAAQLDPTVVARCDALFAALRDDPRLPRGKVPQLIKGAFRAIAEVLIAHNIVPMSGIGYLVLRPRPNQFRLDIASGNLVTFSGFKIVYLRPSPRLLSRIPGLKVISDAPAAPPRPTLLEVEHEDEPEE